MERLIPSSSGSLTTTQQQSYSLFCIISFINHTFSLYVRYIQMMMWKLQKDCWDIDCVLFHLASRRTKLDKREEKNTQVPYLTLSNYTYLPCLCSQRNYSNQLKKLEYITSALKLRPQTIYILYHLDNQNVKTFFEQL